MVFPSNNCEGLLNAWPWASCISPEKKKAAKKSACEGLLNAWQWASCISPEKKKTAKKIA
ncbi:hypothetical protein HPP92_022951 [Vanilla planifolia]|uniref:Uncharacterized protein n=1 Tax=Vanilla planifolia TaxID=51239 RepID=A0A835UCD8_VANPL|nr:hypothetical protein HPP92_022951 [Vanilla planifolia]